MIIFYKSPICHISSKKMIVTLKTKEGLMPQRSFLKRKEIYKDFLWNSRWNRWTIVTLCNILLHRYSNNHRLDTNWDDSPPEFLPTAKRTPKIWKVPLNQTWNWIPDVIKQNAISSACSAPKRTAAGCWLTLQLPYWSPGDITPLEEELASEPARRTRRCSPIGWFNFGRKDRCHACSLSKLA